MVVDKFGGGTGNGLGAIVFKLTIIYKETGVISIMKVDRAGNTTNLTSLKLLSATGKAWYKVQAINIL